MQVCIVAATLAAPSCSVNDAGNDEKRLVNDMAKESANSQPATADDVNFPPAADDSRKTPTSSSAQSELTVHPLESK